MKNNKKQKISKTDLSIKNNKVFQINLKHVKLSKKSKSQLKKIKEPIWGNVVDAIECGDWHIPSVTYEFIDIKRDFEKNMYGFFNIPSDAIVEIDYFDTEILSFEKGIYPKWHK